MHPPRYPLTHFPLANLSRVSFLLSLRHAWLLRDTEGLRDCIPLGLHAFTFDWLISFLFRLRRTDLLLSYLIVSFTNKYIKHHFAYRQYK